MYRVCVQSSQPRNGISKICCGEDTEYVRFLSLAPPQPSGIAVVCSLALWHSQPITPKRCLCPLSQQNKTPCQGLGFPPVGSTCSRAGRPRRTLFLGWEGTTPLCQCPGMPWPCCPAPPEQGGGILWRAQAVASLTGRVGSLLLGADPFLYFICALNWRGKKVHF